MRTIPQCGEKVHVKGGEEFTVRARNERFAICTMPRSGTVMYFIADAEQGIRGPENLVFGMGAETDEECAEMLCRVASGETEISSRYRVPWDLEVASE